MYNLALYWFIYEHFGCITVSNYLWGRHSRDRMVVELSYTHVQTNYINDSNHIVKYLNLHKDV